MIQQSVHEAHETFELTKYDIIRNTILCSPSRYDAFLEAVNLLFVLQDYIVVQSVSVSHNLMYLADNEGHITTYTVVDDEII
jgi:hypothetical protein